MTDIYIAMWHSKGAQRDDNWFASLMKFVQPPNMFDSLEKAKAFVEGAYIGFIEDDPDHEWVWINDIKSGVWIWSPKEDVDMDIDVIYGFFAIGKTTLEKETKMTTVWQVTMESEDMAYDAGCANQIFSTRELAEQWVTSYLNYTEYTVHKGVQQGTLKQEYTNYVIDDKNEFYVIGTVVDQEE